MRKRRLLLMAGALVALTVLQGPGAVCRGQEPWAFLRATGGVINCVAFSPDGKTLAVACADGTIELWEVYTHQRRATLTGHQHQVTSVSFSADGKQLASASIDTTVRLWDATTGREKATLKGHTDNVAGVAFRGDSKLLA